MDWIEAVVLGIIQGLTEFLPISSTGHLLLGRHFFRLDEAGLFLDSMLHIGTLIAVMTIYWKEIKELIRQPFSRLSLLLVAGTVPTVIIGLSFKDYFEEISRTGITVGWEFLATGCILWLADSMKSRGYKELEDITLMDAVLIGSFQGAAILPAVSRSGLTIAAALFRKIDRGTAAYFSFLLSIPAIAGGCLLQIKDVLGGQAEKLSFFPLFLGTVMSAVFGYLAVKWMIALVKKGSLKGFAVYVWLLGFAIIGMQAAGLF
ncbi:undecaprenyl-diphosphate phosphatase [Fictibacillus enclensis]|uniref:undecaprenyl-diphosphate phosphatase n=1 Tax=Fictibacillus enclensis TaxID=1017270 RepID=UPI0024C08493|nr:undecaprenyl-diphosphate phosphatase [Fictibacillus enclensis]MDM5197770.1 undecaprenyl-diphosphate phosphatase [Fictibacillus enclensis]MDM5336923.1 undecaprenyl-diphosphate phosphatase [Fictibacillus enclensis]WHY73346.1 undecaprenyl-diphosphate phosphatase [Fictibacillus enclensis]